MDAVARKQFVKKWTRKINFLSYVSCLYVYIVHATVTKVLWRQGGRHRNGNTSNRYLFRTQSRKRSREKFRSKDVGVSYFPLKRISPAKIFFPRFYGPRGSRGQQKRKRVLGPIFSHYERTSLVSKVFNSIARKTTFPLREHRGKSQAAKMRPTCPLRRPITMKDSLYLARSWIQPHKNISSFPYLFPRQELLKMCDVS